MIDGRLAVVFEQGQHSERARLVAAVDDRVPGRLTASAGREPLGSGAVDAKSMDLGQKHQRQSVEALVAQPGAQLESSGRVGLGSGEVEREYVGGSEMHVQHGGRAEGPQLVGRSARLE